MTDSWQSHSIEYKQARSEEFPTLAESKANNRHKNRRQRATPRPQPVATGSNAWNVPLQLQPESPAPLPTTGLRPSDDDEWAINGDCEWSTGLDYEPEIQPPKLQELLKVKPRFVDKLTSRPRYNNCGYKDVTLMINNALSKIPVDPTHVYRSLVLQYPVRMSDGSSVFSNPSQPGLTPNWASKLPDQGLNQEYWVLCHLRDLGLALGPNMLEKLMRKTKYLEEKKRTLPRYKSSNPPKLAVLPVPTVQNLKVDVLVIPKKTESDDVRIVAFRSNHSHEDRQRNSDEVRSIASQSEYGYDRRQNMRREEDTRSIASSSRHDQREYEGRRNEGYSRREDDVRSVASSSRHEHRRREEERGRGRRYEMEEEDSILRDDYAPGKISGGGFRRHNDDTRSVTSSSEVREANGGRKSGYIEFNSTKYGGQRYVKDSYEDAQRVQLNEWEDCYAPRSSTRQANRQNEDYDNGRYRSRDYGREEKGYNQYQEDYDRYNGRNDRQRSEKRESGYGSYGRHEEEEYERRREEDRRNRNYSPPRKDHGFNPYTAYSTDEDCPNERNYRDGRSQEEEEGRGYDHPEHYWRVNERYERKDEGYGREKEYGSRKSEVEYGTSRTSDMEYGRSRQEEDIYSTSRPEVDYRNQQRYSRCRQEEVTVARPIVATRMRRTKRGRRAPEWKEKEEEWREEEEGEREPSRWHVRVSREAGVVVEEEEEDEERKREWELDARAPFPTTTALSTSVRKAFRCLRGVPVNGVMAVEGEDRRVELSTWSAETDADSMRDRMRDKYGWREEEERRERERMEMGVEETRMTLSLSPGGSLASIDLIGEEREVIVSGRRWEEVKERMERGVKRVREFEYYRVDEFGAMQIEHATLLTYDSSTASLAMREEMRERGVDARRLPRSLVTGYWNGGEVKKECILELEWERVPTIGFEIALSNPDRDWELVQRVIREAGEHFSFLNYRQNDESHFFIPMPHSSPYHADDDERFLNELMMANDVACNIRRIRHKLTQMINSEKKVVDCTFAINRRMLKVAIEERVWGGFHPSNPVEWNMMLEAARFPWTVSVDSGPKMFSDRNSARVHFNNFEQGERIATAAQRHSPSQNGAHGFTLNAEDRKGVFCRARLRVHLDAPVGVRAAVGERLRRMDEEWRESSGFSHKDVVEGEAVQWACLISDDEEICPPGYCRLIVEGFPRSHVEACSKEVIAVLMGDVMQCGEEEKWLMTGIGRHLTDIVVKEAREEGVLIDLNMLGGEIRLIGEREKTERVERRLREIVRRRESHIVKLALTIGQPVYMNTAERAINAFGGLKMMETVVGECSISPYREDPDKKTIVYEGTIGGLERLRAMLAELDDTMRESARAEVKKKYPEMDPSLSPLTVPLLCPICYCRPSIDFYRLEECGHVYCTACLYHQLDSEISARSLPLSCKREECGRPLAVSDLRRLLIGEEQGDKGVAERPTAHLDHLKLRPLVAAAIGHALQTQRDFLLACRTPDCRGILARAPSSARAARPSTLLARCRYCAHQTCTRCGHEPHEEWSCEEYEEIRESVDVSIATYTRNKMVRKCPKENCKVLIEKTEGCNHMQCSMCRTHFCWLCGFTAESQGDIYGHMQDGHGGFGLDEEQELMILQFEAFQ